MSSAPSSSSAPLPEAHSVDADLMKPTDDGLGSGGSYQDGSLTPRKGDGSVHDGPTVLPVLTEQTFDRNSRDKTITSVGYMLSMGICGIVLVALGSTLSSLAANVGKTATEVGTVFVTRGCGAILGAIFSAKLYQWFPGNYVMFVGLLCISVLLTALPFNKSNVVLHVLFLFLGVGTAVTDTGCQIMTRKLHGKTAGPWLGANTVSFGISGAFVPLVEIFTESLYIQYFVMTVVVFTVALLIGLGPNPEAKGRLQGGPPRRPDGQNTQVPHYRVEVSRRRRRGCRRWFLVCPARTLPCAAAVGTPFAGPTRPPSHPCTPAHLCSCPPRPLSGGHRPDGLLFHRRQGTHFHAHAHTHTQNTYTLAASQCVRPPIRSPPTRSLPPRPRTTVTKVTTTAYIVSYVNETSAIDPAHANYLVLVLWVAITIGRLAGVYDQRFLTNKVRHPLPLSPATNNPQRKRDVFSLFYRQTNTHPDRCPRRFPHFLAHQSYQTLPTHLSIFCVGGFLSMLLVLWFPNNAEALWIGVAFYGLFNGPCVGYCYDLNNRITYVPRRPSLPVDTALSTPRGYPLLVLTPSLRRLSLLPR
jgi:hypothetical protein